MHCHHPASKKPRIPPIAHVLLLYCHSKGLVSEGSAFAANCDLDRSCPLAADARIVTSYPPSCPARCNMFQQLQSAGNSRVTLSLSIAIHGVLLYIVIASPPRFVQPSSIIFGNQGNGLSAAVLYLGPSSVPQQTRLMAPASRKHALKHKAAPAAKPVEDGSLEAPVESARAGSPFGSSATGLRTGYESRPALPVVFPNPAVDRSDIPDGVAGDVVVEVTIDEKGNVAETRVLESLGYGLEQKVLDALKNWRFTPATMNGIAIASRQDVHFHFPS